MKITTTTEIPDPPESYLDYNEELVHITKYDSSEKVKYCIYGINSRCWYFEYSKVPRTSPEYLHHFLIKEKFPKHPKELNGYELEYVPNEKHNEVLAGKDYALYSKNMGKWGLMNIDYRHGSTDNTPRALATKIKPKETITIGGIKYSKEEVENQLKDIKALE